MPLSVLRREVRKKITYQGSRSKRKCYTKESELERIEGEDKMVDKAEDEEMEPGVIVLPLMMT